MAEIDAKELGKEGEEQATAYLEEKGYEILARNYRYKRGEVDIIARLGDCMMFVEVKTRTSTDFGEPESFVTKRQQEIIMATANEFIFQRNWQQSIRFDIIAIVPNVDLEHFEDAFY
jgi:putative endonuclease